MMDEQPAQPESEQLGALRLGLGLTVASAGQLGLLVAAVEWPAGPQRLQLRQEG